MASTNSGVFESLRTFTDLAKHARVKDFQYVMLHYLQPAVDLRVHTRAMSTTLMKDRLRGLATFRGGSSIHEMGVYRVLPDFMLVRHAVDVYVDDVEALELRFRTDPERFSDVCLECDSRFTPLCTREVSLNPFRIYPFIRSAPPSGPDPSTQPSVAPSAALTVTRKNTDYLREQLSIVLAERESLLDAKRRYVAGERCARVDIYDIPTDLSIPSRHPGVFGVVEADPGGVPRRSRWIPTLASPQMAPPRGEQGATPSPSFTVTSPSASSSPSPSTPFSTSSLTRPASPVTSTSQALSVAGSRASKVKNALPVPVPPSAISVPLGSVGALRPNHVRMKHPGSSLQTSMAAQTALGAAGQNPSSTTSNSRPLPSSASSTAAVAILTTQVTKNADASKPTTPHVLHSAGAAALPLLGTSKSKHPSRSAPSLVTSSSATTATAPILIANDSNSRGKRKREDVEDDSQVSKRVRPDGSNVVTNSKKQDNHQATEADVGPRSSLKPSFPTVRVSAGTAKKEAKKASAPTSGDHGLLPSTGPQSTSVSFGASSAAAASSHTIPSTTISSLPATDTKSSAQKKAVPQGKRKRDDLDDEAPAGKRVRADVPREVSRAASPDNSKTVTKSASGLSCADVSSSTATSSLTKSSLTGTSGPKPQKKRTRGTEADAHVTTRPQPNGKRGWKKVELTEDEGVTTDKNIPKIAVSFKLPPKQADRKP